MQTEYLILITVVALLQFLYFGIQVGRARGRYSIPAPATSGHPEFERYYRVQANTLEQLVLFVPVLWMFGSYVSPIWAVPFGVVFVIGRAIYARSYVRDPKSRGLGFGLTVLPSLAMMLTLVVWVIHALVFKAMA